MVLFLFEAYILGLFLNIIVLVQSDLVEPKFQAMSFEISYAISYTTALFTPAIAKLEEPYPSIYITIFCVIGVMMVPVLKNLVVQKGPTLREKMNESI